ncbi:MAG: hypothetical protein LUE20_03965 [Oscillospiraceae bacterium]|nr:hypothetical protein [Oscillospiraceae bacterium]
MKKFKRLISLLLVVVMCVSMTSSVFAAKNACVNVSGSSAGKTTFTVVTGSSWKNNGKITFTQSKGTMKYTNNGYGTSTVSTYGAYIVSYICIKDSGACSTGYWSWRYTKTFSMTLMKNATYIITVTPCSADVVFENCRSSSWLVRLRTAYMYSYNPSWKTNATWNVKSTSVVSSCTKG